MKKVLFSLFIVFNFGLVSSQSINEQKAEKYLSLKGEITFTFKVNNKNEIDHYTRDFSIVNYDPKTKTVKAWANENQFRVFKSKNIPFEVPESENEVDANLIYDNKSKSSTKNLTSKSLANTLSFPVDNYPTYAEYAQQMQDFENDYPTLVDKFSIGSTTENDGKELLFVKISDNVSTDEQEPKLMFTSSMHGDEIAGYPMMLSLIDYILTVYSNPGHADHARVKNLVENAEIWINPSANPDGTYYGSAGNTSVTGARRGNFNNLDLNRNYPDNVAGPHDDGNAYQIETLAFMALADANHFVLSANFHGGTELVNYPFDNAYVSQYTHPDGDWFEFTGVEYATHAQNDSDALGDNTYMTADDDSNVYPSPGVTHGAEWYRVYGGRQDFMNFYHQCKEVTIELSDTKILPESQLVNYWLYNRDALLDYLTQGTYGFRGIVKDANTNTPIETTVTLVGHDAYGSHTYSDATKGDYYRPVKAGTYDILFEADCYQSFTLNNQTILDYETKALADVLLTPITSAVPTNLSASSITTDSASISWDSSAGATFDLRYREVGSFNWIEVTGLTSSPYNISLLNTSTNYEVQVRSVCSGSSSAYTSSTIFTTTAVNYCTSTSSNVNDEYISRVQLNSIDNISGAQFYSDFTNISTILTKNSQYTITITPTWPGTVYTEAYSVWIDYNADGDFNDLGEQVFSQSPINSTNVSGSFTIPSNAIENATRMRVSMQYNAIPTACQSFQYGEVEDYTITIEPAGPDTSAPSTPQNLASSNITENTVDLNWTASNDNVGVIAYDIYQDGNIIDSVSGTSYPVIGLTANTAYNFSVIAKDAAGNQSETSNILNISTLAAPSCVDGIQNGTETGVDCGGSSCAPCSNVQLYEGYFENGLDGWTDGGNDCARVASVNSYEGNYSIQLRDNTGVASSMTSPSFNLSGFDSVEFNFFFYANSMENGEDLLLLYNDGSGWEILTSWVSGSTLINNSINNVAFTLDNSFNLSNNAQFRIQCDASGNNDQVYIDQIVITGINSVDTTAPMITLIGPGNIDINLGDAYTELGATATDNKDGDITANIVIGGDAVDTNTTGTYTVTYNVNDAAGNAATQVDRTVNVVPDTTAPVIALVGNATINLNIGDSYTEEGATATDNKDGDITANILIGGDAVDTNTAGTYTVTYNVSDTAGNAATQVDRTVNVVPDTTAPVIALVGNATINLNIGDSYTEEGATATDNKDGDITANIVIGGDAVDTNTAGTYTVTYNVSDAAGNAAAQVDRTVNIIPDTTAPVITLTGNAIINLNVGDAYTEQGATATDNIDGDISANIVIAGDVVDTNTAGTYVATYNVSDAAGNAATQVDRTVNVIPDTTAPVITLVGNATFNLNVGDTYTEQGATATDNKDGNITANIVIAGDVVDTNTAGTYTVTYNVSDAAGNAATQVDRTVNVTSLPTDIILHEGYFETGWDGWIEGGNDCARVNSSNSSEGSFSIRIRDNSGIASSMTSPTFDLSSYNEVKFDFHFYSNSMEVGEDFWLQYNDGSGFVTINTWARGTDFNNGTFNNFVIPLNSSQYNLTSNAQFRLRCDASGKNDQIFIDEVVITGIGSSGATARIVTPDSNKLLNTTENEVSKNELRLYPNPVKGDILNVKLSNGIKTNMTYKIINALGQIVKDGKVKKEIIVDKLEAGMYFIQINDEEKLIMKRFIKE